MSRHTAAQDVIVSFDWLPKIGGAHTWLYEVYRRWPKQVSVVTAAHADIQLPEARGTLQVFHNASVPADINVLDWRCIRDFLRTSRAIESVTKGQATTLHSLRAFPEGIAALLYRYMHPRTCRLVTYAHGEEVLVARSSRQLRLLAQRVYAVSDLIIANSENTRRLVQSLCPQAKTVCIHPGVDASSYQFGEAEVAAYRSRLGWDPETTVVSTIARMEPRKNHATVMQAVGALRREGLNLGYICAGAGHEYDRLVEEARTLGISDWVRFPGAISEQEKRLIYGASDVYAMPSIHVGEMVEGFGIVFLEAAAAGRPAICGNSGGQAEAVIDGVTGCVVDGNSVTDVCNALRTLVRDSKLRDRMGAAARTRAAQLDWEKVAEKTFAEMQRLS